MNGGLSQFARVLKSIDSRPPTLEGRLEYVAANAADEQERRDRMELEQFTDDYGLGVGALPSWVPTNREATLMGVLTDSAGVQWAFTEEPYETSARKIVPFHTAYGSNGVVEVLNFWASERPTLEHFRKLMEMGFLHAGIGIPFLGNWTCERLDAAYEARHENT